MDGDNAAPWDASLLSKMDIRNEKEKFFLSLLCFFPPFIHSPNSFSSVSVFYFFFYEIFYPNHFDNTRKKVMKDICRILSTS